jgi:FAD dependent oxidoreductase
MNLRSLPIKAFLWAVCYLILCGPSNAADESADVVVVGATPGGIAAAVAAARLGRSVALVEHEDHIGGIVTNGLTNADIGKQQAVGGLFYEFTRRVVRYYLAQDGGNSEGPNVKLCRNGYYYEASVAERIFHEMLADSGDRIHLRLRHELKDATVVDGRLASVTCEDLTHPGQRVTFHGKVFVDATYEGDLAAMAKAPYRVGREGREEYNEPHAGRVYAHFGEPDLLPGSTGEADRAIQAFCFRLHVTRNAKNSMQIEKPVGYNRNDYRFLLEDLRGGRATKLTQFVQLYPMPNGKWELNSNHPDPKTGVPSQSFDLAEECWDWPEATPEKRHRIYVRYLNHNVGLIWFLANDPEVPAAIREEASQLGWCRDEWPKNGNVPRQVYVRQGRRILGDYVLTERDGDLDPALGRTKVQPTSIAVLEFPFDSHACHRFDPAHPGVREGYVFIKHEPLQVPYGVLVPRKVDGLLVPVAASCSHIGYNALRMEPVFMALGETCGIAAHLAMLRQTTVRAAPVAELQQLLVTHGGVITFYDDLKFDDPSFPAFQWLGARGLNFGYEAAPGKKLTRHDGAVRLARVLKFEDKTWTEPAGDGLAALRESELTQWLKDAGYHPETEGRADARSEALTLAQFADLTYRTLRPHQ